MNTDDVEKETRSETQKQRMHQKQKLAKLIFVGFLLDFCVFRQLPPTSHYLIRVFMLMPRKSIFK